MKGVMKGVVNGVVNGVVDGVDRDKIMDQGLEIFCDIDEY